LKRFFLFGGDQLEYAVLFENVSVTVTEEKKVQTILHDISGSIPKGKILTLVGPSGSGKSTLLSVCNLFITPADGQVFVMGREIRKWQVPTLRKTAGMVLQTPTMVRGTVLDNLTLGAKINGYSLDAPGIYLKKVGLTEDFLTKSAGELSGGQKQRVAIARTLINQPQILLLDEVTSALDPTSTKEIEDLILQINREQGTTVLWVTHNLEQARRVGDLTWLLVEGKIIEKAETRTFFERPDNNLTRQFLQGQL
jgi:putative ABC transport system ATP-binding protein